MKFIIATYGTEGDARPFAALSRGLIDAGHEPRLLADASTLGSAQAPFQLPLLRATFAASSAEITPSPAQ